jgi:hypothetical protein
MWLHDWLVKDHLGMWEVNQYTENHELENVPFMYISLKAHFLL